MGKTLLILGNGFDLAHGLPTKYSYFLDFCKRLTIISRNEIERNSFYNTYIKDWQMPELIKHSLYESYCSRRMLENQTFSLNNIILNEIYKLIKCNCWYSYLISLYEKNLLKGENWIDFESEISYIIEFLDKHHQNLLEEYENVKEKIKKYDNDGHFDCFDRAIEERGVFNRNIKELRKILFEDLKKLTVALEYYLKNFIKVDICSTRSQEIFNIKPDHVINFNYTDTYERLYDSAVDVYHIHGAVKESPNINENNMVLGIDEYWSDEEKDNHTNFTIFKKFAQRIQKRTGQDYKRIHDDFVNYFEVESIKSHSKGTDTERYKPNIYIFGHSLDVTDKDILKLFLDEDSFKVTIFCRDEETEGEYIANVIKIIGEDKLIKKVNSYPPQIEFVIQQEMKTSEKIKSEQKKECAI